MDSITQAALGAAVGEALLGEKIGHKAAIIGAVIATIPDLDVLITPMFSAFEKMAIHRGYSHSIIFCILGAGFIAYLLSRLKWTKNLSFWLLYLLSFSCLFTHVLLDAFTTYGTQLFLPFADWRVSFDNVNIIDPVYTLPLLFGVLLAVFFRKKGMRKASAFNTIGLILSSLYMVFTLANKQQVERIFEAQLKAQDTPFYELLTVPIRVGNMVWYGVAKDKTNLYIGKYSILEKNQIDFHAFPINDALLNGLDTDLVQRLKWVAQGFYTVAEKDGKIRVYNMQCDMQGVRTYGDYQAPTAFYYEILPKADGYELTSGMHQNEE